QPPYKAPARTCRAAGWACVDPPPRGVKSARAPACGQPPPCPNVRAHPDNKGQAGEADMLKTAAAVARLGTESAFEVLARAKQLEAQGRDIINLGIGQPDFKTPDHVVEAAVKALRDGHHGYTPANGIVELREAVAEDLELRH